VDESDHLTLVNAGDEEVVSQEEGEREGGAAGGEGGGCCCASAIAIAHMQTHRARENVRNCRSVPPDFSSLFRAKRARGSAPTHPHDSLGHGAGGGTRWRVLRSAGGRRRWARRAKLLAAVRLD